MLVAKTEENYYYNENIRENVRNNNVSERRKNTNIKSNSKNKLQFIMSAIIALMICLLVLYRYAHITQMRLEITQLESQKIELEKEKQDLLAELDRVKSSSKIEEDAKIKLGMDYPTEEQIVYISMNESVQDDEQVAEEGFFLVQYIKSMMDAVLKLF
ncbi:septum formation initiator family protein [Sporanaerobacter acetigenes]|uniref:Cell division protein FtsL n=1 Tax=Sporanaerobacter acetigenes DSM 13106 TaxID=1123281 RepID=A0A1M5UHK6_9FIRM|nr:cell division protein FtsL [Sporanaerobacter acetigenes]SHH62457.1 cell division protein FtsL [Sporanaerobacter acetigenes DSM 13106]